MAFRFPRRAWKALTWTPVAVMFTQHFCTIKHITGRSMQPTLNPEPCIWRDLVVFDRLSVHVGNNVKRGDVVSLQSPINPGEYIVKRIVGLEGDVVQTLPPYPEPEITVPEGHVWVEGDESFWTLDSNSWGPVPLALVDARLAFVLWPHNRFGFLNPPTLCDAQKRRSPSSSDAAWKRQMAEIEREKWRGGRVDTSKD